MALPPARTRVDAGGAADTATVSGLGGPLWGGTAGNGGEKSGGGSRRMAERGQGEPLPRELVSLAIRCFRNGTAPLPRLILRRCGPWLFRRSGGDGGAGGERREGWRVDGRRKVDEWGGEVPPRGKGWESAAGLEHEARGRQNDTSSRLGRVRRR